MTQSPVNIPNEWVTKQVLICWGESVEKGHSPQCGKGGLGEENIIEKIERDRSREIIRNLCTYNFVWDSFLKALLSSCFKYDLFFEKNILKIAARNVYFHS